MLSYLLLSSGGVKFLLFDSISFILVESYVLIRKEDVGVRTLDNSLSIRGDKSNFVY